MFNRLFEEYGVQENNPSAGTFLIILKRPILLEANSDDGSHHDDVG